MDGERRASARCSRARAGMLGRARARTRPGRLCAREEGRGQRGSGRPSLWSHRSPVCKEWCVCV